MKYEVIIIGGGQAGCMLAVTLRQQKFLGSILIISDEDHLPYQKPPLSKGFLSADITTNSLYFKSSNYYEKNHIDILLNSNVANIDRLEKSIALKDGKKLHYKTLSIATGSELNKLDLNCENKSIYYLKTISDAIKIRSLLDQQKKIVIIGGGYIGLEIAAAASKKNNRVIVLEASNRVMSRSVCSETSDFFQTAHEKKGVSFFFNAQINKIDQYANQKLISLNNNESINADAIIIGVGVRPKVGLAYEAGLDCENGITVNKFCQTSDKNIFAIGDCANYPNPIYKQRLRLESVQNAIEQAKIAASKINDMELPRDHIPWFWSDQYNIKLRIAGVPTNYEDHIVRGNTSDGKFSVFYQKEGYVIAMESINDTKSFSAGKKIIKNKIYIPSKTLKDKNADLKSLID